MMILRSAKIALLATTISTTSCAYFSEGFLLPSSSYSYRVPISNTLLKAYQEYSGKEEHLYYPKDTTNTVQNNDGYGNEDGTIQQQESRRSVFQKALNMAGFTAMATAIRAPPSNAGLVQFPCNYDLMNTYHFLRAGESLLEQNDLISTNPLFMTNREDALSPLGREQIQNACNEMMMKDINPSVVKYSIAAKSIDTANIIAEEMNVGRNRLVPEYTFMDPRGVGAWNMESLSRVEEAVWAMDSMEAGEDGKGGRPPPTDDGTANEVLSEQVTRLRQLMSILETQFSGDTILLIFGDGTSPALLMSLIAGLPLNRVHELDFKPGEIRYDVTKSSVLESVPDQISPRYVAKVSRGKETLKELREELNNPPIATPQEQTYPTAVLREPRKKKAENDQRHKASPEKVSREDSNSNMFFPSVAAGCYMYASAFKSNNTSLSDVTETSNDDLDILANDDDNSLSPEIQEMERLISVAPFDIPEMRKEDILEEERVKRAQEAMDDYFNRGDGADEWLEGLANIIDEE